MQKRRYTDTNLTVTFMEHLTMSKITDNRQEIELAAPRQSTRRRKADQIGQPHMDETVTRKEATDTVHWINTDVTLIDDSTKTMHPDKLVEELQTSD